MGSTIAELHHQSARPIERLPIRRLSNEPREAMNCKSCRKRKIKCNRTRPSCGACKVFKVECVYDAVPRKRGPKKDVLEALLKRVNGLEERFKEGDPTEPEPSASTRPALDRRVSTSESTASGRKQSHSSSVRPELEDRDLGGPVAAVELGFSPVLQQFPGHISIRKDPLLELYFERVHGKPFYILDEAATRQRWTAAQLPPYILDAVHAVSARYAHHLVGGHNNAVRLSEECCARARMSLNSDEPTIENLQTALLLASAFFQAGRGKRSYMLLSTAISMALALGLHRELSASFRVPVAEREGRRKLFWTCYLMDRFAASGSRRPSLIADESIALRLPAWSFDRNSLYQEGAFFSGGSSNPMSGGGTASFGQSAAASLIDITRILGVTNRYLAAGGVKGDSHFPWHSQSNLSKIRHDLEMWSTTNQEVFLPIETLFTQPEAMTTVLARLIYHLVHCLIYRPLLPVDLIELAGTEQHQPWQLEASNLCFLHANATADLVEVGRACSVMEWPAFVGYCLCTAGTVHVHGAHYVSREGDCFARSGEYLSREMALLNEIRVHYAGVQHQKDTLQAVYGCHSQLVKSLATNPMRFSPVYQMEDFFDRYPGQYINGAHLMLMDIVVDQFQEGMSAYAGLPVSAQQWPALIYPEAIVAVPQQHQKQPPIEMAINKRRRTNALETPADLTRTTSGQSQNSQRPHALSGQEQEDQDHAQTWPPRPTDEGDQNSTHTRPTAPTMTYMTDQQTLGQNAMSPNFQFSPWPLSLMNSPSGLRQGATVPNSDDRTGQAHQPQQGLTLGGPTTHPAAFMCSSEAAGPNEAVVEERTPGGLSAGSVPDSDKDPFLTLLEQLAENEGTQDEGPSDLYFLLRSQSAPDPAEG